MDEYQYTLIRKKQKGKAVQSLCINVYYLLEIA